MSRHSRVPSYLSSESAADTGNASFTATAKTEQDRRRRRALARRTLIEVLNEALELLHDDEVSDHQPNAVLESPQ